LDGLILCNEIIKLCLAYYFVCHSYIDSINIQSMVYMQSKYNLTWNEELNWTATIRKLVNKILDGLKLWNCIGRCQSDFLKSFPKIIITKIRLRWTP